MGDNMRGEVMILDLNQEPVDQPHDPVIGLESFLNELETAHGRIEERIRQLEAVTTRARQRQRWRQAHISPQIMNITAGAAGVVASDVQNEGNHSGEDATVVAPETLESGKTNNRGDNMHLIAKALEVEMIPKKAESRTGSFYDCNICLDMAKDPILTCCGHLFCWPCFYQLSYADSIAKECPVCKGEVTDATLIPIYGNGDGNSSRKSKAPPRPQAHRIEGLRQLLVRRGPSIMIEERIQQLSNIVGTLGERTRSQDLLSGGPIRVQRTRYVSSPPYQASPATGTSSHQQHDSVPVSRLLQGAASVSSLSSAVNIAMDSADRLVEDLEAYSNSHHVRRNHQRHLHIDHGDTSSSIAAVIQPDSQTSDSAAEINSNVRPSASLIRTDSVTVDLEDLTTDFEINSTLLSSSSRRRAANPRGSHVNNGPSSEPRRRRLR